MPTGSTAMRGERLQVTGEQTSANGTIITTEIIQSNGEPVRLNYLLRQNGGAWQIADVYLNGTISELATRRSEFSSILRTEGSTAWSRCSTRRPTRCPRAPRKAHRFYVPCRLFGRRL